MTRSASAFWLSALVISASAGAASAADQAIIRKAAVAPEVTEYGNLYYGFDWNSHRSLVGYMGVLYAPYGMDKSGLRVSAFGLGGDYRYHGDPGETFKGRFVSADALIGWSHVFNNGAATLQVGANYQDHRIRPTDRTLVYALASYSTAFNTYYSVGRLGYDFFKTGVFFGPEVGGLGNDRTDQFRFGAHLTDIKLGPAKVTLSSGWMRERDEGSGWYATGTIDFSF